MIPRYLTTEQIDHLAEYASVRGDSGNTDVLIAEIDAHEELQAWM